MQEWMLWLVGILVIISILGWIFKAIVKAVVVAIFAVILFNLVFVWNGGEMAEKLHLSKWLDEDTVNEWVTKYDDYALKREEISWIQASNIKEKGTKLIDDVKSYLQDQTGKVDRKELIQVIKAELEKVDEEEANTMWQTMKVELVEWGISDEDMKDVLIRGK